MNAPHVRPVPQKDSPVAAWYMDAPINATLWLPDGRTAMAAVGDGNVYIVRPEQTTPLPVPAGEGTAVLTLLSASDNASQDAFVTTDTGEVGLVTAAGDWLPLGQVGLRDGGPFLEHTAYYAKTGLLAVATGKFVHLYNSKGDRVRTLGPHASTVAGLAVSPVAPRLAVAHYNGVTIWPLDNPKASPRLMEWKGAHAALTYSPDGKWLISAMQEQALHLWRLSDGMDLQMRGYPGKIGHLSWSHDGQTLATSGGFGVPLWSFHDKLKGPAGSQARVVAVSDSDELLVTAVACHPKGPFAAVGYTDGLVLLTNLKEDNAVLLKTPDSDGNDPITSFAWSPDGLFLVVGTQKGWLGLVDFAKLA